MRSYGYGVSGNIDGDYGSWDKMVIAHEIGHNFGLPHTHDGSFYDPIIDNCGNQCFTEPLPVDDGTIMSYCHLCGAWQRMEFHERTIVTLYDSYDAGKDSLVSVEDCLRTDIRLPQQEESFYLMSNQSACVKIDSPWSQTTDIECELTDSFVFDHYEVVESLYSGECIEGVSKLYAGPFGSEITFELLDAGGNHVCSGSVYESWQTVDLSCCIHFDQQYEVFCIDSYGYGWNGGYIEFNGEAYCTESFGASMSEIIVVTDQPEPTGSGEFRNPNGHCWTAVCDTKSILLTECNSLDPAQHFSWAGAEIYSTFCELFVTDLDGNFALAASPGSFDDFCAAMFIEHETSLRPTGLPSTTPTQTPTWNPVTQDDCRTFEMVTKYYANEISWNLAGCSGSDYGDNQRISFQCCIGVGHHDLTCDDYWYNGWHSGYLIIQGVRYCEGFRSGGTQVESVIITTERPSAMPSPASPSLSPITTFPSLSPNTRAPTAANCRPFHMVTLGYGVEITWELGPCNGTGYKSHREYDFICCLDDGYYDLSCMDSFGDGWSGAYLEIDGIQYCKNFNSGSLRVETVLFGLSHAPSAGPSTSPTTTTTTDSSCRSFHMITKSYGSEISWTVGNCEGNSYISNKEYDLICCIEDGEYELSCNDAYGDGWNEGYLEIDGIRYCEEFITGTLQMETVLFGPSNPPSSGPSMTPPFCLPFPHPILH